MFSAQDYNIMLEELLYREEVSFDMLCYIAEKSLRATVNYWCKTESALAGGGFEDELMGEIHLRLIKTVFDFFLLGDGAESGVADDHEQFGLWLLRVATNTKDRFISFKLKHRGRADCDREKISTPPDDEFCENEDRIAKLRRALTVAFSTDATPIRVLCWLSEYLFVLDEKNTGNRTRMQIIEAFEERELSSLATELEGASVRLPWLSLDEKQVQAIRSALAVEMNGRALGGYKFGEVLIGGGSRKQISDWFYEMDEIIGRFVSDGASEC